MMVQLSQSDGGSGSGGMGLVDTAGGGRGAGIGDIDVPIDIWGGQSVKARLILLIFIFHSAKLGMQSNHGPL